MKNTGRKLPVILSAALAALGAILPGEAKAADASSSGGAPSIAARLERIREVTQPKGEGEPLEPTKLALGWVNWGNWGNWGNWSNWRNAWGNFWSNF